jgi:hypothetical protein
MDKTRIPAATGKQKSVFLSIEVKVKFLLYHGMKAQTAGSGSGARQGWVANTMP